MGVRLTDPANVALYDSVTGWAFGTTFPSAEHAEDFLRWLAESDDRDARTIEDNELEALIARWRSERVNDEGDLIEPTPTEA
jgi:hypothetical protein